MDIVAKTQAKSKGGSEFFQNFCHNGLIRRDYAVDVCVVGMFTTVDGKRCRRRYQMIVFDQRNRSSSVTTLCTLPEYLLRFSPNDVIMTTRTPFRVRV